jgi:hypothetical protein
VGLSDKIKEFIEWIVDKFTGWVSERIAPAMMKSIEHEIALKSIDENLFMTPEVRSVVQKLKEEWKTSPGTVSEFANSLITAILGKGALVQLESIGDMKVDKEMPITNRLFTQMAIITDVNLLANIIAIVAEVKSAGMVDQIGEELHKYFDYSGLSQIVGYGYGMLLSQVLAEPVSHEISQKMQTAIIPLGEAVDMYHRKIIDEPTLRKILAQNGFSTDKQDKLIQASYFYPSPQDIITWLAREVYEPEKIQQFGLLEDYDKIDKVPLYKARLTDEQIKNYWVAHWQHPSYTQMAEMYHRDIIDKKTFYDWFALVEIPPYWREKLMTLTERPLTRVDTRRAFEMGAITKDQMRAELEAFGYRGERLNAMVQFYESGKVEDAKKLTKSSIIKGLKKGIVSKAEATELLMDLNYDRYSAEFIIASELSESSPESFMEYKELTQLYRKAIGLPTKDVSQEMKDLEARIYTVQKELKKLEEEKGTSALIADRIRLLTKLKQSLAQLQE